MAHRALDLRSQRAALEPALRAVLDPALLLGPELGRGGQGSVFEIFAPKHEALKVTAIPNTDVRTKRRYQREIAALQQQPVPGLLRLTKGPVLFHLPAYPEFDLFAYTMPLARLGSLEILSSTSGHPRLPERAQLWGYYLAVFRHTCEAIQQLHDRDFLHRDIKPANILFLEDLLRPCVSDFGLAISLASHHSATKTGERVGNWYYMAPEQDNAAKATLSASTDVFALGKLLYFLLVGQDPHHGPMTDVPELQATSARAKDLILRCTKPAQRERYQSVGELLRDLTVLETTLRSTTALGYSKATTLSLLHVAEDAAISHRREHAAKLFQGQARPSIQIKPRSVFSITIARTGPGRGRARLRLEEDVIFLRSTFETTVSVTATGKNPLGAIDFKASPNLTLTHSEIRGRAALMHVVYPGRIEPYLQETLWWEYNALQPFGPDHDFAALPIVDYVGRAEIHVRSDLPFGKPPDALVLPADKAITMEKGALLRAAGRQRQPTEVTPNGVKTWIAAPQPGQVLILIWYYRKG